MVRPIPKRKGVRGRLPDRLPVA